MYKSTPVSQAEPSPPPFPDVISNRIVTTLNEGTLYSLSNDSNPAVNSFTVDHTKKHVVATKVSTVPFSEIPFDVDAIDKLFVQLGMNWELGLPYKMVIVGMNDMSMPNPTGMGFAWKNRTESLAWWQNETRTNSPFAWPNSLRIKTYLMRVPAYDMPAFELPGEKGKRKKK
eukprot:gene23341-biopygen8038